MPFTALFSFRRTCLQRFAQSPTPPGYTPHLLGNMSSTISYPWKWYRFALYTVFASCNGWRVFSLVTRSNPVIATFSNVLPVRSIAGPIAGERSGQVDLVKAGANKIFHTVEHGVLQCLGV